MRFTKIGNCLEKAGDTTQLNERPIATDIRRGIQPPYNADRLAVFVELNETFVRELSGSPSSSVRNKTSPMATGQLFLIVCEIKPRLAIHHD